MKFDFYKKIEILLVTEFKDEYFGIVGKITNKIHIEDCS
jgi:hypothetical protein